MYFLVRAQQLLVHLASTQTHARCLDAEETFLPAEKRFGFVESRFADKDSKCFSVRFAFTRVTELEQRADAAVDAATIRIDLLEVFYPVATFADGCFVTDGQSQQGLQFADTQVFPERSRIGRQTDQCCNRTLIGEAGVV